MLKQVWDFLKNPMYVTDENKGFNYRFRVFIKLLLLSVSINIVLGMLIGSLETVFGLNLGEHALDRFFEKYPTVYFLLGAVITAPVIEELIFRGPMILFKNNHFFGVVFYVLTLVFGFYHITNFELNGRVLLLSPILVAPQLVVGGLLGFIRIRFGLIWSIALHACYNLVLAGPIILMKMLNIPLE
ncbi:CPBP family intramembrane glutamic endopeptidase [Maribacter sp. 2304DJ31-5]|uniref:CPBP family intramembrane glutamic endopeptidase n=1 Tax=Maribacter sp. 2304DJ31-5 TaxID=3386273 RepID=UPI0039BD8D23